jgi:hypothetical protein
MSKTDVRNWTVLMSVLAKSLRAVRLASSHTSEGVEVLPIGHCAKNGYSYLNATTGSTCVARRAGI